MEPATVSTSCEIKNGTRDAETGHGITGIRRKEHDMPEANELLRIQHEVASERDPERRLAAIERAYVEDLQFLDRGAEVVGREAFSDGLQKILDDAPPDFVLEVDGPAYVGPDTAAQPWRFGPPGNPVIRGMDVLTLRDGRIAFVRGLIAS